MRFALAVLSAALLLAGTAGADLVHLKNGGVLEGKVTRKDGKIHIAQPGGVVVLDEDKVEYIEEKETALEIFERRFEKIGGQKEGAAGVGGAYVKLGRFCEAHRLKAQAVLCYRKAIAAEPGQEAARAALGYVRYKGVWMTHDEVQQARGLVRHKDAWVTPEAKADLTRLEAAKELERAKAEVERLKLARAEAEAEQERLRAEAHHRETAYDPYDRRAGGYFSRYGYGYGYGFGFPYVILSTGSHHGHHSRDAHHGDPTHASGSRSTAAPSPTPTPAPSVRPPSRWSNYVSRYSARRANPAPTQP